MCGAVPLLPLYAIVVVIGTPNLSCSIFTDIITLPTSQRHRFECIVSIFTKTHGPRRMVLHSVYVLCTVIYIYIYIQYIYIYIPQRVKPYMKCT